MDLTPHYCSLENGEGGKFYHDFQKDKGLGEGVWSADSQI